MPESYRCRSTSRGGASGSALSQGSLPTSFNGRALRQSLRPDDDAAARIDRKLSAKDRDYLHPSRRSRARRARMGKLADRTRACSETALPRATRPLIP